MACAASIILQSVATLCYETWNGTRMLHDLHAHSHNPSAAPKLQVHALSPVFIRHFTACLHYHASLADYS